MNAATLMMDTVLDHIEHRRPRIGANVIVVDGKSVDVWVHEIEGEYIAELMDGEGGPTASRSTIAAALGSLRELLSSQCEDCRDGECDQCDAVDYERENGR